MKRIHALRTFISINVAFQDHRPTNLFIIIIKAVFFLSK